MIWNLESGMVAEKQNYSIPPFATFESQMSDALFGGDQQIPMHIDLWTEAHRWRDSRYSPVGCRVQSQFRF